MQMATKAQAQLYPLGTEAGAPIPLEIIWPVATVTASIPASGQSTLGIPVGTDLAAFYSTIDAYVDFTGVSTFPIAGVVADSLFLPAGTLITAAVPVQGISSVVPMSPGEAGKIVVQVIERWVSVGQPRSLVRK
jgi:hypothetical protein